MPAEVSDLKIYFRQLVTHLNSYEAHMYDKKILNMRKLAVSKSKFNAYRVLEVTTAKSFGFRAEDNYKKYCQEKKHDPPKEISIRPAVWNLVQNLAYPNSNNVDTTTTF